jgi:hypothetical protein
VQAPRLLEGPDRRLGAFAENARTVGRTVEADTDQPRLKIADGLAGVLPPQQQAYRNSCSS